MRSFADAEPAEDHPEQIVGAHVAGDRRKRLLRAAELLGEELQWGRRGLQVARPLVEMRARDAQRMQVALACQKCALHVLVYAGCREHGVAEQLDARTDLGRET